MKYPWEDKVSKMRTGGHLLAQIRDQLVQETKPGMTLKEIDTKAEHLLLKTGGQPAFKTVKDYYWSTCINVNEGIVHGIPNEYKIQDGDLVSLDIGLIYEGYYTDTSTSFIAGSPNPELGTFLQIGRQVLQEAIAQAKIPNHVGHISQSIEIALGRHKLSAVEELTGHGVGKRLHEPPMIPGFITKNPRKTPKLEVGQTLAIEIIYTPGVPHIKIESDGWTISTIDGNIAGLFEETVVILENGPEILTAVS